MSRSVREGTSRSRSWRRKRRRKSKGGGQTLTWLQDVTRRRACVGVRGRVHEHPYPRRLFAEDTPECDCVCTSHTASSRSRKGNRKRAAAKDEGKPHASQLADSKRKEGRQEASHSAGESAAQAGRGREGSCRSDISTRCVAVPAQLTVKKEEREVRIAAPACSSTCHHRRAVADCLPCRSLPLPTPFFFFLIYELPVPLFRPCEEAHGITSLDPVASPPTPYAHITQPRAPGRPHRRPAGAEEKTESGERGGGVCSLVCARASGWTSGVQHAGRRGAGEKEARASSCNSSRRLRGGRENGKRGASAQVGWREERSPGTRDKTKKKTASTASTAKQEKEG